MSQRLSRKEIKHEIREDAFRHGVGASVEYVLGHRRLLLGIIAGVVLLAAGIAALRAWLLHRERAAGEQLGKATVVLRASVVETGATPDDPLEPSFATEQARDARAKELLEAVREEHGGTAAAAVAGVHLGRLRLEAGDEQGARELWEEFLDDHDDHLLASAVRVSLLDLDRRNGKAEQVATQLRENLEGEDKRLPEDVLLYELAVTLEQLGKPGEARETYQRIGDEYPDSPFAQKAAAKARELGGEAPAAPSFTVQPS